MEYNLGQRIWQGTWLILPLYPYFNDETKQIYPVNIFKSMRDSNWTFQQLKDFLFEFVEFIKWIEKVTDDYLKGVVKCSDCKKTILESEIAGRYFAGIYCEDCWNSKWKKIEEKETYD